MRFVNEKKMLMNDAMQTQKLSKKMKIIEKFDLFVFDHVNNVDKIVFNTRFFKTKFAFRRFISLNLSSKKKQFNFQ